MFRYINILNLFLIIFATIGSILILAKNAGATAEWVYVIKILSGNDEGIILRTNGEAYKMHCDSSCLSFRRYEGNRVFITYPDRFLDDKSMLILPNTGEICRVLNSELLGLWKTLLGDPLQSINPEKVLSKEDVIIFQTALKILGYYKEKPDGIYDQKSMDALILFQKTMNLDETGVIDFDTAISLSKNIYEKFQGKTEALNLAIALLNIGKRCSYFNDKLP